MFSNGERIMEIPLSMSYKGRMVVIEAKTDEDKRKVEDMVARNDWVGLQKYIIQDESWGGVSTRQ